MVASSVDDFKALRARMEELRRGAPSGGAVAKAGPGGAPLPVAAAQARPLPGADPPGVDRCQLCGGLCDSWMAAECTGQCM